MTDYNELAQYHQVNPDPLRAGCSNTGTHEDGVSFPGIEPVEGSVCFIGRSSLYEAVAALHNIKVDRVKKLLGGDKKNRDYIKALEDRVEELEAALLKWGAFVQAAEDAGLVMTVVA